MASILYFEDLQVGACWRSPSRLISADDVRQFAQLTGDHTPLHSAPDGQDASVEHDFPLKQDDALEVQSRDTGEQIKIDRTECRSPFGRPVVHGLLGLGILAGLSSEHPRVSTLALVKLGEWQFHHPIYFGEMVYVETEVLELKAHGRRAGKVLWQRRLHAKGGRVLQSGQMQTIVARREPTKRRQENTKRRQENTKRRQENTKRRQENTKNMSAPSLDTTIILPSQVTSN